MNVNEVLKQRQKTHGDFKEQASISQDIKNVIKSNLKQTNHYSSYMIEALDMIAHKIARIANGNPYEIDHWVDIAGYATLVVKELEKHKPKEL